MQTQTDLHSELTARSEDLRGQAYFITLLFDSTDMPAETQAIWSQERMIYLTLYFLSNLILNQNYWVKC